jgi:predicted dehydrogenase
MKRVRVGVIGWGYWGPKITRNLASLPWVTVAAVADRDPHRLEAVQRDFPGIETTTSATDIFCSDVDGVVIATPVLSHYDLAKQALMSGKHVLVEKPLTASVVQAEELVALARARNLTLMVGHTFEYSPAVNELRKLIQSGELGHIYSVHTERLNLGLFRSDIDVIWDLAPHDVSILMYLLGHKPVHVDALAHAHLRHNVYDTAHLHLEFPQGTTAYTHVSWLYPCKTRRVTVVGDQRMAVYDDTNPSEMIRVYNKGADIRSDPGVSYRFGATTIPYIEWDEPLRIECADFIESIRTGATPRANGSVGLEVVRVLEEVHEVLAVSTKKLVAVPA